MTKAKKTSQPMKVKSGGRDAGGVGGPTPAVEKPTVEEELVVFAFRLTPAEREVIHAAAGPGKASRFVRAIAIAAASGDEEAVLKLLGGPAPAAD
ncbi:MAG: hypothetical protein ABI960_07555 [Candidatus Eisenbacteria bacterium]